MASATMYHFDRTGPTTSSPRPYSYPGSVNTIKMATLARRPVGLTFPSATPSSVTLRMTTGVVGDYVVFALPYPAGTTFTVTKWGGAMTPSTSVATLTYDDS